MPDGDETDRQANEILGLALDLRIRAEATLLRSILMFWDEAWVAIEQFCAVEFDDQAWRRMAHRALWRAMRRARESGVSQHAEDLIRAFLADKEIRKQFRDMTWGDHEAKFLAFLRDLHDGEETLPSPASIPPYLDAVMRAHQRERVRFLARNVADGEPEAVEDLQRALDALSGGEGVRGGPTLVSARKGLPGALSAWKDEARPEQASSLRIPWHIFPRFDGGGAYIRETDYALLAARPARGKSTAAIQIAVATAARFKRPVLYVSLEMPARQVWQKAVLAEANVADPAGEEFSPEDLTQIVRAKEYLEREVPLVVLDRPPPNLWRLKAHLSHLVQAEHPILTVIDYLGLIQAKGDEYQRVTLISQHLRAWAMVNTPVLMVHQLSRASVKESSRPRIPRQSDLRGSGQIEQDATHIVFLHEAGGIDNPKYDYEQDPNPVVPMLALLSKARQGRPGIGQRLVFDRAKSRMLPNA